MAYIIQILVLRRNRSLLQIQHLSLHQAPRSPYDAPALDHGFFSRRVMHHYAGRGDRTASMSDDVGLRAVVSRTSCEVTNGTWQGACSSQANGTRHGQSRMRCAHRVWSSGNMDGRAVYVPSSRSLVRLGLGDDGDLGRPHSRARFVEGFCETHSDGHASPDLHQSIGDMYETLSSLRTVQTEFFSPNKDERVGAIDAADSVGRASELYDVDRGTRWQDSACHRSSWRLEVEFDGAAYGGDSVKLG